MEKTINGTGVMKCSKGKTCEQNTGQKNSTNAQTQAIFHLLM
jgi:hypothetical protein